jgi:IrrE N-terminal-like domain
LIRVKEDILEPGRKRFAIAHDMGHWLLHKNVSQVLACTSEDMVAKYKASAPEIEANYFAAELLMPEKLFAPRIDRASLSVRLIKDLAADFQTTLTATAIRLRLSRAPPVRVVPRRAHRPCRTRIQADFNALATWPTPRRSLQFTAPAAFFGPNMSERHFRDLQVRLVEGRAPCRRSG